jgi:hypothetical protein
MKEGKVGLECTHDSPRPVCYTLRVSRGRKYDIYIHFYSGLPNFQFGQMHCARNTEFVANQTMHDSTNSGNIFVFARLDPSGNPDSIYIERRQPLCPNATTRLGYNCHCLHKLISSFSQPHILPPTNSITIIGGQLGTDLI